MTCPTDRPFSALRWIAEACGVDPDAAQSAPVSAPPVTAPEAPPQTADGHGVAYAYNPGQGPSSNGAYHLVAKAPIQSGRLRRAPGDALCKPARRFWGLDGGRTEADFNSRPCARCAELRLRLQERAAR